MMTSDFDARPAIAAELKRRILVEAGHRCAIPTCRHIEIDIHHIIPWAQCQTHEYGNLIALCSNCHRRADRGDIDRKSLRLYKFNLRFAHDKFSNLEMDVMMELAKLKRGQAAQWPEFNLLLLKRITDAGYVRFQKPQGGAWAMGMSLTPLLMTLSDHGRNFIAELGKDELG